MIKTILHNKHRHIANNRFRDNTQVVRAVLYYFILSGILQLNNNNNNMGVSSDRPDGKHKVKSNTLTRSVIVSADEHAIYNIMYYVSLYIHTFVCTIYETPKNFLTSRRRIQYYYNFFLFKTCITSYNNNDNELTRDKG